MSKQKVYQQELERWTELFAQTDDNTKKAADGLIQKAAFLHSMCWELEQAIVITGSIKIHPDHPDIQKQIPAVKEYARLSESYSSIVNRLNMIRLKNTVEEDDELNEYE